MHAQIAGTFDGREVARFVVRVHARQKVLQHGLGARGARLNAQSAHIGRLKAQFSQCGNWNIPRVGARCQALAVGMAVVPRRALASHAGQPGAQIGGEHAIRLAGLGQHLATFKNHVVFDPHPRPGLGGKRGLNGCVTLQSLGLVVVGSKYCISLQGCGQAGNLVRGDRVASDQPCVRLAGELAHISIQLGHAGLDELHPPVLAGQGVQDAAVKHKHAMHLGAALQGERERGVVGGAQVAPEPDQSSGVNGLHACR